MNVKPLSTFLVLLLLLCLTFAVVPIEAQNTTSSAATSVSPTTTVAPSTTASTTMTTEPTFAPPTLAESPSTTAMPSSVIQFELVFTGHYQHLEQLNLTSKLQALLSPDTRLGSVRSGDVMVHVLSVQQLGRRSSGGGSLVTTAPNSSSGAIDQEVVPPTTRIVFVVASIFDRSWSGKPVVHDAMLLLDGLSRREVALAFGAALFGRAPSSSLLVARYDSAVTDDDRVISDGYETAYIVAGLLGGLAVVIAFLVLLGTRTRLVSAELVSAKRDKQKDAMIQSIREEHDNKMQRIKSGKPMAPRHGVVVEMPPLEEHGSSSHQQQHNAPRLRRSSMSSDSSLDEMEEYSPPSKQQRQRENPLFATAQEQQQQRAPTQPQRRGGGGLRALSHRNDKVGIAHRSRQQQQPVIAGGLLHKPTLSFGSAGAAPAMNEESL